MKFQTIALAFTTPLMFALLPIISILSHNDIDISLAYAVRPASLSLLAAVLLVFVLWLVYKNPFQASAAASLSLVLFFSYGHVYGGFLGSDTFALFSRAGLIGNRLPLLAIWAGMWLISLFVIHRIRLQQSKLTTLFTIFAVVALAQPGYKILSTEWLLRQAWDERGEIHHQNTAPISGQTGEQPDIYYIILDGYARSDILNQVYGYDNSRFLDFLEEQGFFIAAQSHSNYAQTMLSLASSLNYDYLDGLATKPGKTSSDRLPPSRLIRHSQVRSFLETRGYRIVNLASGFRPTELEDADLYLTPGRLASTSLERLLIDTSALFVMRDVAASLGVKVDPAGYVAHRQRIEFALESLPHLADERGPKFVFVHIVEPHPPFVFGPGGEPVYSQYPYNLLDGDAFAGTRDEYARGYVDQLDYLNHRLQEVIQALINASPTPPVIILQADHGPGMELVWHSANDSNLDERFSILNAYYLPGRNSALPDKSITPVNTFRFIFNLYFNTEYPLLDNRIMFSTWDQPYDFIHLILKDDKLLVSGQVIQ